MARRRRASRSSSKKSDFPYAWLAVGGVAALGAYLLYTRSASASSLPAPGIGGTGSAPPALPPPSTGSLGGGSGSGGSSSTGSTPGASVTPTPTVGGTVSRTPGGTTSTRQTLPQLLQSSAQARKTYFFQATLYSYHITEALPDGKVGPTTRGLIAGVWRDAGLRTSPPTTVTDQVIKDLPGTIAIHVGTGAFQPRAVPGTLPQALIDQINREMAPLLVGTPLVLQQFAA